MMAGFALKLPADPRDVLPAYFISGEDLYPGRQFLKELGGLLAERLDIVNEAVDYLQTLV